MTTPLQALAGQIRFKLDKKVADRLTALDRAHQLAMQRIGDLNSADISRVWTQLQKKAADALKRSETITDVEQIAEPSKEAVRGAAADARASLKHSLREIGREAHAIAGPEVRRFVLASMDAVAGLAANEKEIAASFNIPHRESPLVLVLREEVARLEAVAGKPWHGGIQRPADFVAAFAPIL
ncbi:MAG: hypothetical protein ACKPGK_13940 [Verrucomicrobiota bacterium]